MMPSRFSWNLDTPVDLVILLVCVAASTWTTYLLYAWWQVRRRPRMTLWATATTIVSIFLLLTVAQPSGKAFHRDSCAFGLGSGTVWIKIEPRDGTPVKSYHLTMRWGPLQADIEEVLYRPTYFTTNKDDFFSREAADILVEPAAYIPVETAHLHQTKSESSSVEYGSTGLASNLTATPHPGTGGFRTLWAPGCHPRS